MTSLEKLSNISPTSFNSSRFLYSIASHTRVLVSVLKTDQKVKRKISFQSSNERQLVKAKGFQAFQEQQLVQSAALRVEKYERPSAKVNVLVATSGDTGSAVANGFLGVEGIRVYVLYPKGLVSPIQEYQFTTLGQNITALEVDGTFDDCQAIVKLAFMDPELNYKLKLTSANSINVARFLPQAFYYFYAYAQLKKLHKDKNIVMSVPSGNFGNLTAGLFAKRMGLPVKRFIAANNRNDIFLQYLQTGEYKPRPSVSTIANAMDVGDPSNFARILDLYGGSHAAISAEISGVSYTDKQIGDTMKTCLEECRYVVDPHGACAFRALREGLQDDEVGVFLETAHPAKFVETVERYIDNKVIIPFKLKAFMYGEKKTIAVSKDFGVFKNYLLSIKN